MIDFNLLNTLGGTNPMQAVSQGYAAGAAIRDDRALQQNQIDARAAQQQQSQEANALYQQIQNRMTSDPDFALSASTEFSDLMLTAPEAAKAAAARFESMSNERKREYFVDFQKAADTVMRGDLQGAADILENRVLRIQEQGGSPDDSLRALNILETDPRAFVSGVNNMMQARHGGGLAGVPNPKDIADLRLAEARIDATRQETAGKRASRQDQIDAREAQQQQSQRADILYKQIQNRMTSDPDFALSASTEFSDLMLTAPEAAKAAAARFESMSNERKREYFVDFQKAADAVKAGDTQKASDILEGRILKIQAQGGNPDDSLRALNILETAPESFVNGVNNMMQARYDRNLVSSDRPVNLREIDLGDRVELVDPETGKAVRTIKKGSGKTPDEIAKDVAEAKLAEAKVADYQQGRQRNQEADSLYNQVQERISSDPSFDLPASGEFADLMRISPEAAKAAAARFESVQDRRMREYAFDFQRAADATKRGDVDGASDILIDRVMKLQAEGGNPEDGLRALKILRSNPEDFIDGVNNMMQARYDRNLVSSDRPVNLREIDLGDRVELVDPETGKAVRTIKKGSGKTPDEIAKDVADAKLAEARLQAVRQETSEKKIAAQREITSSIATVQDALRLVDNITKAPNLNDVVGNVNAILPTISGQSQDLINDFMSLKSMLTIENLEKMKGVLSDADIKILSAAASSLNVTDGGVRGSEPRVREIINEIKSKFRGRLTSGVSRLYDTGFKGKSSDVLGRKITKEDIDFAVRNGYSLEEIQERLGVR